MKPMFSKFDQNTSMKHVQTNVDDEIIILSMIKVKNRL